MCLSIISQKKYKNAEKIGYGYKWFDYCPSNPKNKFFFPYSIVSQQKSCAKNVWLKSTDQIIPTTKGDYESGFHIYLNEQDAIDNAQMYRRSVVVKVWFKNVVAHGKNCETDLGNTVIAKNMKVSKIIYINK